MQHAKIPSINDKFDASIFTQILKKTYGVAIALILISIIAAFLYLRYTPPLYNSVSIIQINENNRSSRILNIEDVYADDDISKVIELLRSKEFLKRAFAKLPLEVSYFVEGTFLSSELYDRTPFVVEYKSNSLSLYDKPFYIEFHSLSDATLSDANKEWSQEIKINKWNKVNGGELKISIRDYRTITDQNENYKYNDFFFVINNPQKLVDRHIQKLQITLLNRSAQTIQISYTGNNSEKSAQVVNTIAGEYLKYDVEVKKVSADNILDFIEEQLRSVYKTLDETEKQLHAFKKENKLNMDRFQSTGSPFPIFTTKLNEFEDELINLEFELVTLQRIKAQIGENENLNIYELVASLYGTKSENVVVNALNNLQQLITQKEKLLNDVTPDNLKIVVLEKQIENQKQLLVDFVGSTVARLEAKKQDYEQKISEYEDKIFQDRGFDELEYSKLERLYDINEGFYNKLIEKKAEYLISQAGHVSNNTILEKAFINKRPISPIPSTVIPLFVLMGLFLGGAYIVGRYLFYNEITSIASIQNYTKAPILGTVPNYKHDIPVSQLLVNKKPNSIFSEAFRTIRSNLQFISHGAETKIVTVSSTISGEGKTFVAINLAGIIAISGKKVIILDLDLRKPRIHMGFNVENEKGISTILIDQHTVEDCIRKSDLENFDYITAGPIPPNPAELANGPEMEALLEKLEKIYDVIIIDTPPVGIVTDALDNLQRANYPIYVMKANVSKRHFINNINYLMDQKNMDNLSVVLNGVDLMQRKYGQYGYAYGYGYGYYHDEEEQTTISEKITKKLQKLKK